MQNRESFQTAKSLVDFIRDFTSLSEAQLRAVRTIMEQTVQDVMNNVGDLSSTAVQPQNPCDSDSPKSDGQHSAAVIALENKLRTSGGKLAKQIEAMGSLDKEIQSILLRVVGSVSMDDVLGQRLNHVINSIAVVRRGIKKILLNTDSYNDQKSMKHLKNQILTEVYRSYTSEEEKEIFHKIFGHPKSHTQAS